MDGFPPTLVDFGFINEIGGDTWNVDNNGSILPLLMTKPFILLAAKFEFRPRSSIYWCEIIAITLFGIRVVWGSFAWTTGGLWK